MPVHLRAGVEVEPTFTIENLANRHRVVTPDGVTERVDREWVFETVLALDMETREPRLGFTVEVIASRRRRTARTRNQTRSRGGSLTCGVMCEPTKEPVYRAVQRSEGTRVARRDVQRRRQGRRVDESRQHHRVRRIRLRTAVVVAIIQRASKTRISAR